jgi:hypothetical protein
MALHTTGSVIIDEIESYGLPITSSWSIPKGQAFVVGRDFKCILMHPSDFMKVQYGRTPWWTRYCEGVREIERDQRIYGKR